MNLELKIHPPIVFGLCVLLAWGLSRWIPYLVSMDGLIAMIMVILPVTLGVMLALAAVFQFSRAKTTIHPDKPDETSALVVSGVYRLTRNPMYLALLCLLIGWVLYLQNPWAAVSLIIFVGYITRFQIHPEERILADKFGQSYADYRNRVRRWI